MKDFFSLRKNGTTVRIEVIAGLTTFFTMAYILVVNPVILGDAGMPFKGVFVATILSAVIGTVFMGVFANVPYALAPGMGLNAFFTYTIVLKNGFTWEQALGMVFICGIINIFITFTNIRKTIIKCIPETIQSAIGGGIGLFIAYIGVLNVGMVTFENGIPSIGDLSNPQVYLTLLGLTITIILLIKKSKASLLIGIITITIIAVIMSYLGNEVVDLNSVDLSINSYKQMFNDFNEIFGAVFSKRGLPSLFDNPSTYGYILLSIFSFSLTDTFDTIGTFIGTGKKSGIFSDDDKKALESGSGFSSKMDKALFADSIATSIGSILGTSNTTTYVESSAGIGVGGRTGLTSLTVAGCFLLSLFLGPIISIIPYSATAPALIAVGIMMTSAFADIKWADFEEAIPCFLAVLFMVISYSIADGIAIGFISYSIVKISQGKFKQLHPILIVSTALFLINYLSKAFTG